MTTQRKCGRCNKPIRKGQRVMAIGKYREYDAHAEDEDCPIMRAANALLRSLKEDNQCLEDQQKTS